MTHSKLPFRAETTIQGRVIRDANGRFVATAAGHSPLTNADAEFLCRAANHIEDAITYLEAFSDMLTKTKITSPEIVVRLDAFIKSAKGDGGK